MDTRLLAKDTVLSTCADLDSKKRIHNDHLVLITASSLLRFPSYRSSEMQLYLHTLTQSCDHLGGPLFF